MTTTVTIVDVPDFTTQAQLDYLMESIVTAFTYDVRISTDSDLVLSTARDHGLMTGPDDDLYPGS